MKLIYPFIVGSEFIFNSSPKDFIVEEVPLYEFSGTGEHIILTVRKKELTTWELTQALSSSLGIPLKEIGYAGLKDKNAMTIQHISIPKRAESSIENFTHPQIKILNKTFHTNKIRVGHLKGNNFNVRLKKVLGVDKDKIESSLKWIKNNGIPNYFGNQRFGTDGINWEDGKKIIEKKIWIKDKKTRDFLIGSYQSYLFNSWLSKRMELNLLLEKFNENEVENIFNLPKESLKETKKQLQFFKVLKGDVMMHYPYGRLFFAENLEEEAKRFESKDISITGLLAGKRVETAKEIALNIETQFKEDIPMDGTRRYAWIFPKDIVGNYIQEKAHYELKFFLPKGSYATNLIDFLKNS